MCVYADRDSDGSGKSKISKLDSSFAVDEKVLWLEITMNHTALVAEAHGLKNLKHRASCGSLQIYLLETCSF